MRKMVSKPPQTATDVLGLIGFFGFYQEWIPWYEVRIRRWRDYKKGAPPPNSSRNVQTEYMKTKWTDQDQRLLQELANEIESKPL